MDELVRSVFETDLPAVRGAWRRGNEKELPGVRQGEMLITRADGCVLTEVDANSLAKNSLAIPDGANANSGLLVKEGHDDATERFQRGEGVDEGGGGDEVADLSEVVWGEDVDVVEIGKEKSV